MLAMNAYFGPLALAARACYNSQNSRNGSFEPKSASFALKEETPEGTEKKLGSASIDLRCA